MPESDGPLPINPSALIHHARSRIEAPSDRWGTNYRRAVSDAYFALFHALTLGAASLSESVEDHYELTRRFEHRNVRNVARWVTDAGPSPSSLRLESMMASAKADPQVRRVAMAIRRLHSKREDADYNHRVRFTRSGTLELIDIADEAVATVTGPAFATSDGGGAFLRMLAAQLEARPPSDA